MAYASAAETLTAFELMPGPESGMAETMGTDRAAIDIKIKMAYPQYLPACLMPEPCKMGIFTFLLPELGHGASRSSLGAIDLGRADGKEDLKILPVHGLGT